MYSNQLNYHTILIGCKDTSKFWIVQRFCEKKH